MSKQNVTRHLAITALALSVSFLPSISTASVIERACLSSDRQAVSRALCNCVQQVADLTLNGGDQKLASTFFRDPHRAQEVRQSDRASDERFWQRYKSFSASAQSYCRAVSN